MSIEQLRTPRIKVATDYPGSKFKVGQIIELAHRADKEFSATEEWFVMIDGTAYGETWFQQYPHIFKPLQWWEEREKEDLTGYIKLYINDEWRVFEMNILDDNLMQWKFGGRNRKEFLPATEIEYLTYINSKK